MGGGKVGTQFSLNITEYEFPDGYQSRLGLKREDRTGKEKEREDQFLLQMLRSTLGALGKHGGSMERNFNNQ